MSEDAARYPLLFEAGTIGSVEIRNRVVQLPMGTGMAEDGRVGDRDLAIQEERAAGGVGLIVFGGAVVHPTSRFPARILIEAWDEAVVDSLRGRAEAVHRHGARMFGQLIHLGRESPGGLTEAVPLAPSPIPSPRDQTVPHEMTEADIEMLVDAFGRSAANYAAAGIDGAEVHAAHGYLVAQFLSPASNQRMDEYGGSVEARTRFLVEIVREIRSRVPPEFVVGVRLSADEHTPGGLALEDTLEIVDVVVATEPVDYFSITTGQRGGYVKDTSWSEGFALDLAAAVKRRVDVPVICAGRIRHPDLAERALAAGQADFVGIGRGLLADPQWAEKARSGRADTIRPCVGILQECRRYGGGVACAVNARLGREREWPGEAPGAIPPRRVVVAGGGPGGLEAARVAAEAGHDVVLYERASALGGQLRTAAAGPTRGELADFVSYLEHELDRLGVDVRCGTDATASRVLADEPQLVVCATGARPLPPAFAVEDGARVVDVWDLLDGRAGEIPRRAVVVDDGAGFWHAISAAELLAEQGAAVELVTPSRAVGLSIPEESVGAVLQRLGSSGVRFRTLAVVTEVAGTTVSLADVVTGKPAATAAELVVVRTAQQQEDVLVRELAGDVPALVAIGDCASPRRLGHAVLEANLALRRFHEGKLTPVGATLS